MDSICTCLFPGSESLASSFQSISASLLCCHMGEWRVCSLLHCKQTDSTSLNSSSRSTSLILLFLTQLGRVSSKDTICSVGLWSFAEGHCTFRPSRLHDIPFSFYFGNGNLLAGFKSSSGCWYGYAIVNPDTGRAESIWVKEAWF